MKLDKEDLKKIRHLILFAIIAQAIISNISLIFQGLTVLWDIVFPFVFGGAIAFVLNVPMRALENRIFHGRSLSGNKVAQKIARPVSLVLTIILVLGVILAVLFIVIPELGRTLQSLVTAIQNFIPLAEQTLEGLSVNNQSLESWMEQYNINIDEMLEKLSAYIQSYAGNIVDFTVSAVKSLVNGVANFVIAFVFSCYILMQKEKLLRQAKKILYAYLSEKHADGCVEICSLTARSFSNFLTGQCVEALQAIGFVVLFLVLQQIEGNFIYPKVVGNSVGLPSIWVLACVTIGGKLMGVVGMLIFIPIASVVYSLLRTSVNRRLARKNSV